MKRRSHMVLLLSIFVGSTSAMSTADGPNTFRVVNVAKGDVLRLRAGPGVNYPVVEDIDPGASVIDNGWCADPKTCRGYEQQEGNIRAGHWCYIFFDGKNGWVNSHYLGKDDSPSNDEAPGAFAKFMETLDGRGDSMADASLLHVATIEVSPQERYRVVVHRVNTMVLRIERLNSDKVINYRIIKNIQFGSKTIPLNSEYFSIQNVAAGGKSFLLEGLLVKSKMRVACQLGVDQLQAGKITCKRT